LQSILFLTGVIGLPLAIAGDMKAMERRERREREKRRQEVEQAKERERQRIGSVLSSPDPFLEAWRSGQRDLLVHLVFYEFQSAGLLECDALPVNTMAGLQLLTRRRYRLREGVDLSLFNRWEQRVASCFENYTSLQQVVESAQFEDLAAAEPSVVSPFPIPDPALIKDFMAVRLEALEDVYVFAPGPSC
jgi:hypothetical protein